MTLGLETAFECYRAHSANVGHYSRNDDLAVDDPAAYLEELVELRTAEVAGWLTWWGNRLPLNVRRVLDAGCGPGTVTLALARHFGSAEVHGIDVETEAIALAQALAAEQPRCRFEVRALEQLETELCYDLIVCRTTLEHVADPRRSLTRMVAALAPGGALCLETPNYLFPREPHVGLWMLPKSPKWLLRAECALTGRDASFVDHLRFECDPITLRRWARTAGGEVDDLAVEKASRLLSGQDTATVPSRQRVLDLVRRIPVLRGLAWAALRLPVAPSAQLLIHRPVSNPQAAGAGSAVASSR